MTMTPYVPENLTVSQEVLDSLGTTTTRDPSLYHRDYWHNGNGEKVFLFDMMPTEVPNTHKFNPVLGRYEPVYQYNPMTGKVLQSVSLPRRANRSAAGWDLHSAENVVLEPGQSMVIKTGVTARIPPGYVGMVCSRSGLAAKRGISVVNSPGIIDQDYTGEIMVILSMVAYPNREPVKGFYINTGDRIAQFLLMRNGAFDGDLVVDIPTHNDANKRGSNGLGSTGMA